MWAQTLFILSAPLTSCATKTNPNRSHSRNHETTTAESPTLCFIEPVRERRYPALRNLDMRYNSPEQRNCRAGSCHRHWAVYSDNTAPPKVTRVAVRVTGFATRTSTLVEICKLEDRLNELILRPSRVPLTTDWLIQDSNTESHTSTGTIYSSNIRNSDTSHHPYGYHRAPVSDVL